MIPHLALRYTFLLYVKKTLKYNEYELLKDKPFKELPVILQTKLLDPSTDAFVEQELSLCDQLHVHLIEYSTHVYPKLMTLQKNMPPSLYVQGSLEALSKTGYAIVGSRKATLYGLHHAYSFAKTIANHGLSVISGLAYGIDTKAHEGCLDGGGLTIAVVGNGINQIYPASNANLHHRIVNQGCVISEFPFNTAPYRYNFPVRNRIISALSDGVIVVEASEKSGALITVDYALDQGKEVYAIPGNINSSNSKGTNRLIKNGAVLLDSDTALFPEETTLFPGEKANHLATNSSLADIHKAVLNTITEGAVTLDDILLRMNSPTETVLQSLSFLEMMGYIKKYQQTYMIQNTSDTTRKSLV